MAQVPVTPGRSVQVQPLDIRPLRYARSRDFVSGTVQQFGQQLQQSAETWDAIEATYDQADNLAAQNTYASEIADEEADFLNLKGDLPGREMKDRLKRIDTRGDELLAAARSERSRSMMREAFLARKLSLREVMTRHADKEMWGFTAGALKASSAMEARAAVAARGTPEFAKRLETALMRNTELGKHAGWSENEISDKNAELTDSIWFDTIVARDSDDGEPTAALALKEQVEAQLFPGTRERLDRLLRPRVVAAQASAAAPGFIDAYIAKNKLIQSPESGQEPRTRTPVRDAKVVAEQLYPGINVTSHRRAAGAAGKAGGRSWHVKSGAAVDAAPIAGMTFAQYVQGYRDKGYAIIEAVDETDPATMRRTGATGPHWHVVLGQGGDSSTPLPGVDPHLDPEVAEAAAREYAQENSLSETETTAYVAAAVDLAGERRQQRTLIEQEAERLFDETILAKGIDLDSITDVGQLPASAMQNLSPSSRLAVNDRIRNNRERIAKEQAEATEAALFRNAVDTYGIVAPTEENRKRANLDYASRVAARGEMTQEQRASFDVGYAYQVGFVPSLMRDGLAAQLRSPRPELQVAAARTIGEMGARNPALLGDFSQEQISRAVTLNQLRQSGYSAGEAAERLREMERVSPADRSARGELFTARAKAVGKAEDILEETFGEPASDGAVAEFNRIWKQEYETGGDIEVAKGVAAARVRSTYGISRVNGSAQVMRTPPERHYGVLDKGERDAAWMRRQALKEFLTNSLTEPNASDRFRLVPQGTRNGQPVYAGALVGGDGVLRWISHPSGIKKLWIPDYRKSEEFEDEQKRRRETVGAARGRRERTASTPRPLPTAALPRGPKI